MTVVAPAVRLVAALRSGVRLVARPGGVAHLYAGALTPSGRWVVRAGRTVCGARTRRLQVLAGGCADLDPGRGPRMCRRCMPVLPPSMGRPGGLVSRDDWLAAYAHLTVEDLKTAARWACTVDQSHQVGFLAQLLFDPPKRHTRRPLEGHDADVVELHRLIETRRRVLVATERTPEERAHLEQQRADETHNRALADRARRQEAAVDRALERSARGGYLLPHERQLLSSA